MRIVLDTSVIVSSGYTMATSNFQILLKESVRAGHLIFLPNIVYDELINKYNEALDSHVKECRTSFEKINRLIPSFSDETAIILNTGAIKEKYKHMLDQMIKEDKLTSLPYPQCSHQQITQRALMRRKPFDAKGHVGYRDALIWESILELATQTPDHSVAFITGNTGDFADPTTSSELHKHLREDVERNDRRCAKILLFKSVDEFVSSQIDPTLTLLDSIRLQLANGKYPGFDLESYAERLLYSLFNSDSFSNIKNVKSKLGFPSEILRLKLFGPEHFDDLHNISVSEVRSLANGTLVIDFAVSCDPNIYFEINSANVSTLPELLRLAIGDHPILDQEFHHSHGIEVGWIVMDVRIALRIMLDSGTHQVGTWQIRDISSDQLTGPPRTELGRSPG